MALTKVHIIILSVVGVVVFGALSYFGYQQVAYIGSQGIPDPGADLRSQYNEEEPAEDPATADASNPANSQPAQPSQPSQPSQPTPSPPPAQPTPTGDVEPVVDTGEGIGGGILPMGGTISTEPDELTSNVPLINPPKRDTQPAVVEDVSSSPNIIQAPGIPTGLLDTSPPEIPDKPPDQIIPARIVTKPDRYLFNNMTDSAISGSSVAINNGGDGETYSLDHFSPMGEDLSLAFLNNVASNAFEVPVAAALWQPFYFNGNKLLNVGDKLIGQAMAGKNRDRIRVTFTKIIFKDGKSTEINAIAMDIDGTVGVPGYVIGDRLLQALTPTLMEAASSMAETLQDRTTQIYTDPLTGQSAEITSVGNDLQTQGIEAAKNVADRLSQILLEEMEENQPYVLVPAGTLCKARLMAPLDVSTAEYGK